VLIGLVVLAVLAVGAFLLLRDDGDGTGQFSGEITDDDQVDVHEVHLDAGEAMRVIVDPGQGDLDARLGLAIDPADAKDGFLSVFASDIDEDSPQAAFGYFTGELFDVDISDFDLSDDFDDYQSELSEEEPAAADAGLIFRLPDERGTDDEEALLFVAPAEGDYRVLVGTGDGDGEYELDIATNAPADEFDAEDWEVDDTNEFLDWYELHGDQRDFLCDDDFYGTDVEDVSYDASTICDPDNFEAFLEGEFGD
jgi:hypothetical protein